MLFVLLNEGTGAQPLTAQLTQDWMQHAAAQFAVYLNRDVAAYWNGAYSVRVGADAGDVAAGEIVCAAVDQLPDAPDAVAYHTIDGQAAPVILLGLNTCTSLDDVTEAMSHEFAETAADAACNCWCDAPDGYSYAREICDPVESWWYAIGGIRVSDFVLPAFFSPGAAAPYTYLAATGSAPDVPIPFYTAPGGYQVRRPISGGEAQIYGEMAAHKSSKRRHWSSRTYRRGMRL